MDLVIQRWIGSVYLALVGLVVVACSSWSSTDWTVWVARPHDWALTSVDGNVLRVLVAVGSRSCDRFEGIEVSESETAVDIAGCGSRKGALDRASAMPT